MFSRKHQLYFEHVELAESDKQLEESYFVFHGQCMVLGDSGVGKTCLVKSLTGKEFDPNQTKTQGIDSSLVDQKWKNYSMNELVLGDFWRLFTDTVFTLQMLFLRIGREATNISVFHEFGSWFDWIVYLLASFYMVYIPPSFFGCNHKTTLSFLFTHLAPVMVQPILLRLYCSSNQLHVRSTLAKIGFFFSHRGLLIGSHLPLVIIYYWDETYAHFFNIRAALWLLATTAVITFVGLFLSKGLWSTDPQYLHHFTQRRFFQNQPSLVFLFFCRLLLSIFIGISFGFLAASFLTSCPLFIHCLKFAPKNLLLSYCAAFSVSFPLTLLIMPLIHPSAIDRSGDLYGLISLSIVLAYYHFKLLWTSAPYYFVILFPASICFTFYVELFGLHSRVPVPSNSRSSNTVETCHIGLFVQEVVSVDQKMLKSAINEMFSSLKLKILDFAGDKEYYAYHHMFLKCHALYLIVLNMAEFARNDFKDINAGIQRLKFWVESVCSHVPPKTPIFLVGTHSGTTEKNCMETMDGHLRTNLWDSYCDELIENDAEGLVFFPVENSNGQNDFGIQCLQNKIMDVAVNCKENIGRHIPLLWFRMQDAIISYKEKKEALFCLKFEEFPMVFESLFLLEWSKDAFKYFHEQGLLIYLDRNQDLDLSNWVLLKPEILVDIIIQLVTPPPEITQERGWRRHWNLLQKKGLLTKSLLENIISKVQENVEAMTAFLEEYDLICPLANRKVTMCNLTYEDNEQPTHFVPSLLPIASERDTPIWHDDHTDKKCYVFFTKFLPEPLFHHLLSRAHKLSRVLFPNGETVLFRDAGKFWLSARQPYSLKLMQVEKMIEVTFRCRPNDQMRPSDVLCQVFCMVDGICKRNFPYVKFFCGPACPSPNCPGHRPNYMSQSVGEEQLTRRHVFNVMPGRQGDRIPFLYCEDCSFEEELDEWIP